MVYDAQNRRRTVTDRLSGVTTYALNAGGQLTALTDAESQTTSYTYNARGEKTEEQYPDHTSGSPGDATYGKVLFTYDPARRLFRRDDQNGDTVTHTYDTKGNITQNQRTPGTSSTYQNYVWDFDNRMISADTNGDSAADVTYEYDALGRRVARTQGATAVVYIHAGQQTVCDYTRGANANTTPAFRYVWGDYIDEPILRQTGSSTLLYYHHNQQYSTVALTNSSGEVISRYGYTAYGEQSILTYTGSSQSYSSYGNRYTYTGREWDDSLKAQYFRARWYDAPLGRIVNRDPLGYVDGKSLYRGNFGLSKLDSMGTFVDIIVSSHPNNKSGQYDCNTSANRLGGKYSFSIVGELQESGWIVQKVTVVCQGGECKDVEHSVNGFEEPDKSSQYRCLGEYSWTETTCQLKPIETFTYYEAWEVNKAGEVLIDNQPVVENDQVTIGKAKPKVKKCGEYTQLGEIKFFCESQVQGNTTGWQKRPEDYEFGKDERCKTGAGKLWTFDGTDGSTPDLWTKDPAAKAVRSYGLIWSCCIGRYKNSVNNYVDVNFLPR